MCEPKPNNCHIEFLCEDLLDDCYQKTKKDILTPCIHHDGLNDEESAVRCKSKIAQVNVAILFLKKSLGDENLRNYIMSELGIRE